MRIRQKLCLMIAVPVAGLLLLGAITLYTDARLAHLDEHRDLAEEVIRGAAGLQYLSTEYLAHREPQVAAQWRARHAALDRSLSRLLARTDGGDDLRRIRAAHAALGGSFARLAEAAAAAPPDSVIERLLQASATVIDNAAQLSARSAAVAGALRSRVRSGRFLIGLLVVAGSLLAMLWIGRDLMRPIESLRRSAAQVAGGDTALATGMDRDDELGDLARAFDDMTGALRQEIARREEGERQLAAGQQALKRQADELAQSNAELEQFAYIASHDLQEPLRTISSYAQLLKSRYAGQLGGDGDDFIEFIVDGTSRMQQLIKDLLAFSRAVRGGGEFAPVALDGVVDVAMKDLARLVAETKATIDRGPLPTVRGDAGQLAQVIQNLLSNALKFRAEAAPAVVIDAERKDRLWEVRVRDNGIGIEACHAQRIFEPFRRLHPGGKYPGSGIGLALCRKLIARHGGTIWVEAPAEGGSCFCFTVPAADADAEAPLAERAA